MEQLQLPPEWLGDLMGAAPAVSDARWSLAGRRLRIAELAAEGHGPTAIARRLNADGVPTPAGLIGRWRCETVLRVRDPDRHNAYMRQYRRRRWNPGA